MQRRTLLKTAALTGLARSAFPLLAFSGQTKTPNAEVHTVLLVTKCHLDVGFTATQEKVVRKYFDVYYPAAMRTAASLREAGADHYTWTTGSWLLYEYLEQADAAQRRAMEKAVVAGDIAWHALPFSWQTEMLEPSMIEGALSLSATLDQRFGVKTIGAKMTDVPGHSRGIIAPLHSAGISLLDIGVNGASTPPDVPDIFLWKDPTGATLAVMYHRQDYGSILEIPGTGVAVDVEVRGDNSGPHSPAEIASIYAKLRARFPDATIKAATLNDVAAAVARVRDQLPLVTSEIGDTWIYGCASDPYKVARYRTMVRLRRDWVSQRKFASGDSTDRNLLRHLLLCCEHTWGTDTKSYLDDQHYRPQDLKGVLDQPGYQTMQASWKEKRDDVDTSVAALPASLRQTAFDELSALQPKRPDTAAMRPHSETQRIETKHFTIGFDPTTGAINLLRDRSSGRDWASSEQPLALFTYQTLSPAQYSDFLHRYITVETDWAPKDFGKPGIEAFGAVAREWHPRLVGCWTATSADHDRIVVQLAIDDPSAAASGNVAWPEHIFLEVLLAHQTPSIDLRLLTFNKTINRMPEAMWLSFVPLNVVPTSWRVEKVSQMVPVSDVVRGGGRSMHAVSESIQSETSNGSGFTLHTMDAPVVALGERSPLNFSLQSPDLSRGVHICLFNNAWGTNYPQWCAGDWMYRIRITV